MSFVHSLCLIILTLFGAAAQAATCVAESSSGGFGLGGAKDTGMRGIDDAGAWHFSMAYDAVANGAVFDAGNLKIAYIGEEYNGRSNGSVTINGGGSASSQMGSLTVNAEGGVATVTFRGKTFKLMGGGTTLEVSGKTHPLGNGLNTILIFAKDGSTQVVTAKIPLAKNAKKPTEKKSDKK